MEKESSALCINDVLPRHLLTEVLIRISSIDLLRCKIICKLWHSLLDDDPDFVRRFVLQRVRERSHLNGDEEDIHVKWNFTEMVTVTPAWYCADASKFSLDFIPFFDGLHFDNLDLCETVLGSSNGLLLCTSGRSRRNHGARYCICNPITKQWLELPPYRPRPGYDNNQHVKVGFIVDPFYNINHDDHSVTVNDQFGVKVVRLDCSRYGETGVREIDVEVFSSQTGCWTTSKVQLPDHVVKGELEYLYRGVIAPYNGKLYWLLQDENEFLIYDINKNEFLTNRFDPPPSALRYENGDIAPFLWISLCQGSLWMAQSLKWQLRVYMLADDDRWCLKHDIDILNDMEWGLGSLYEYLNEADTDFIEFYTMHPTDHMIGYLATDQLLLKCNFQSTIVTLLMLKKPMSYRFYVLPVYLPHWPTPLPLLPKML